MAVRIGRERFLIRGLAVLMLGMFLVICLATPALAQGDTAPTKIKVFDNIKNAGWVGVLIILLSIAGLSLIITFAMQIRRRRKSSPAGTGQGPGQ